MNQTVKGEQVYDPRLHKNRIATLEAQVACLMQSVALLDTQCAMLTADQSALEDELSLLRAQLAGSQSLTDPQADQTASS